MKPSRKEEYSKEHGFRVHLVDESISKIFTELTCPICFDILLDPIQTPCLHVFCKECIEKSLSVKASCPNDRTEIKSENLRTFKEQNEAAYRMLFGSLKIWCPLYHDKGCTWKGDYSSMYSHIEDVCSMHPKACDFCNVKMSRDKLSEHKSTLCILRPVNCEYCNVSIIFDKIPSHQNSTCPQFPIECDSKGCGLVLPRSKMATHQRDNCAKALITCSLVEYGCLERFQREDMSKHMETNSIKHIDFLTIGLLEERKNRVLLETKLNTKLTRGERVYIFGGYTGSTKISNVNCYNLAENKWTSYLAFTLPNARALFGGAELNGCIYIFGGMLADGYSSTAHMLNLSSMKWTSIANISSARVMCTGVSINGKIYSIGGEDVKNNAVDTTEVYDPITNIWTTIEPMIVPRTHMAVAALNDKIYVFGGRSSGSNLDLLPASAEVLDTVTGRWSSIATPLSNRSSSSAVVIGDKIMVCGGDILRDSANGLTSSIHIYDTILNSWSISDLTLLSARCNFSMHYVASSNNLYVFGGYDGKESASAQMLNMTTRIWTSIESLPTPIRGFFSVLV
jgi:N-acetylneuraminic acid mutarotase